jgi:very-short-patch-repair endonuclease
LAFSPPWEKVAKPDEGGGPLTQHSVTPRMKGFARSLRKTSTPHEQKMWTFLRSRRFIGFRFRRQVPIGPYIVDFVCYGRRLVIELDGSQHADDPTDPIRDAELNRRGFRVLRIWNGDFVLNEGSVLDGIVFALEEPTGLEWPDY